MEKRRLFSDKDGTNFREDLHDIFLNLKHWVKDHADITQPIINVLEEIKIQIREGSPVDQIIDLALSKLIIPGDPDEKVYKWFQDNIDKIISILTGEDQVFDEIFSNATSFADAELEALIAKVGSICVQEYAGENGKPMSRVDSDTLLQLTYKMMS